MSYLVHHARKRLSSPDLSALSVALRKEIDILLSKEVTKIITNIYGLAFLVVQTWAIKCASVSDKVELLLLLNTLRLFAFKIHSIKATIY